MEKLKIGSGQIQLEIVDDYGDSRGVFKFNPSDVQAARRFFDLQIAFDAKRAEFEARNEVCTTDIERADLVVDLVNYFVTMVDDCFGEGSSKVLFGEARTIEMLVSFFEGITPYYSEARADKMAQYKKPARAKKAK